MGPDRDAVLELLNQVVDPCSVAAGLPAGLVDMGLVVDVDVTGPELERTVEVVLTITEPGCLMAVPFVERAREVLSTAEGVASVDVSVDLHRMWTPEDMSADYQAALADKRANSRLALPLTVVSPTSR